MLPAYVTTPPRAVKRHASQRGWAATRRSSADTICISHFQKRSAFELRTGRELKALDRASRDARDLHLRQPNRRRNVGLSLVLDEAHVQNQAVAHRKLPAHRLECEPLVDELISRRRPTQSSPTPAAA